ncbi:MAG: hypothetical protein A3H91_07085 [Gammaproteobacteria bacterium RIFCSPLOWO2_02_FULL_61_13]|nr:MAG: hypothetical protein A3H91_07085 [Gammaproteobacteria bacterium RIFCSPLOWO2_02_FULL_61_13]
MLPLLICALFPVGAIAQEPAPAPTAAPEPAAEELVPDPTPPDLPDRLEDGQPIEPDVTIVRKGDAVVEEYRANGRMFMVKITPKVGKPYYLLDKDGDGRMESRMSDLYEDFAVPQWVIFSW